jgi:hypothetical protein
MPLLGKDRCIWTGWIRQRTLLQNLILGTIKPLPPAAKRYAEKIAKTTGIALEEVLRSQPFKNYLKALWGE